ncbi:MAG: thiamine phosphate synthase [archaeon]
MKEIKGYYFITDSNLSKNVLEDAIETIEGGAKVIQYREKKKSTGEMIKEAGKLKKLCEENNVLFLINDRIDIALAVNADGVHLGQEDFPLEKARELLGKEKVIGVTVHDAEEAVEAEKNGADYVSVSPIFHTDTKKDAGKAVGVEMIKAVKERVKLPITAIGGIDFSNLNKVIEAGADSVSMISAVLVQGKVKENSRKVSEAFK